MVVLTDCAHDLIFVVFHELVHSFALVSGLTLLLSNGFYFILILNSISYVVSENSYAPCAVESYHPIDFLLVTTFLGSPCYVCRLDLIIDKLTSHKDQINQK